MVLFFTETALFSEACPRDKEGHGTIIEDSRRAGNTRTLHLKKQEKTRVFGTILHAVRGRRRILAAYTGRSKVK